MSAIFQKIDQFQINETKTISYCVKKFSKIKFKTLFVVDDYNKLIGSLTKGDIRRGLMDSDNDDKVINICNQNPFILNQNIKIEPAIISEIMKFNSIYEIPIVDSKGILVEVLTINNTKSFSKIDNTFFILAGGKGKRMLPLTKEIPKPMARINGVPMLEHIILKAKEEGFVNFTISIGYLGEQIKNYFKDGTSFDVNISYIEESEPLGTAGSLSILSSLKVNYPIIITNGDVISKINYKDLLVYHNKKKSIATMVVKSFELQNPFGVIKLKDQKIIALQEKPLYKSLINGGLYALSKDAHALIPKNKFYNMTSLFEKLIKDNFNVMAYGMFEEWNDIGNIEELNKLNNNNE
jgi:dTDP-glucose pyrophosphorylase